MTVTVTLTLSGVPVPVELDDDAIAIIADAVAAKVEPETQSEFLTIPETAILLGCGHKPCRDCKGDSCRRCGGTHQVANRQRVDDLLSSGRLERVKDGARTLIRRSDLHAYLGDGGMQCRGPRPRPIQRSSS